MSYTRIGIRPKSSGNKSEGFDWLKAPPVMKRISIIKYIGEEKLRSVLTSPYLVFTVVPSRIGNKSLYTPYVEGEDPLEDMEL